MLREIVVGTVGYTLQLLRLVGEREEVLDIRRADRVKSALLYGLLARAQSIRHNPQFGVPPNAHVAPILIPLHRLVRVAEELDLHLLEFPAAKSVIPRIDLVAKRLADL